MQHQNRITYRFDSNGKKIDSVEQQHEEVTEAYSTQGLNIEQLEQLIRNSDRDIAHTEDAMDGPDIANQTSEAHHRTRYELDLEELEQWAHGRTSNEDQVELNSTPDATLRPDKYEHDFVETMLTDVQIRKGKEGFSWTKGFVAVLCAVLTGTLLGYLLLVQVFGSAVWPSSNSTEADIREGTIVEQITEVEPITDDNVKTVSINMSEGNYSYHLLQAGVFSKEKTRDDVITALKNAGYAAEYTQANSGKYFVYAAIATSVNNIEPFTTTVSGFELYRKELVLQLPEKIQFNGEAVQLESFVQSSNQLIGMYADLVAAQLEQPTLSIIGPSAQQAWQAQYDRWEIIALDALAGFKNTSNESQAIRLQEALQSAQQQMLKYQEKPNSINIWSVEAELVKAVLVQKEWFEQVDGLS